MRVDNKEHVKALRIIHKGARLKFHLKFGVHFAENRHEERERITNPYEIVQIEFSDLREVDNLIRILQEFRDGCAHEIGYWSKERED